MATPAMTSVTLALRLVLLAAVAVTCVNCAGRSAMRAQEAQRSPDTGILPGAEPVAIDNGRARACLLLHGWVGSPADFGELLPALDRAGWDVYAPLHVGHGTTPADLVGVTADDLLSAARAHYAALQARYGTVALVGFSMGGTIATILSAESPPDRLVLIAPYYGVTHKWYYLLPAETWQGAISPFVNYVKRPAGMTRVNRPEGRDEVIAYGAFPTDSTAALFELGQRAREEADLTRLTMPVLLIYGPGDEAADPAAMMAVFERLPGPGKRRLELPRSNHHVLHDYDRAEAIAAITGFLAD